MLPFYARKAGINSCDLLIELNLSFAYKSFLVQSARNREYFIRSRCVVQAIIGMLLCTK